MYTAEEYLYKNNVFIVASFEWLDFHAVVDGQPTYLQQLISPMVTDKYAARMKQHTVRLHATKNLEPPSAAPLVRGPSKIPIHSILLVGDDFHALCLSLRYRLGVLRGFAVVVDDETGPRNRLSVLSINETQRKPKPPTLKIEFRDTCFRVADSALQRDLLEPLSRIKCPTLQVSLKGALRLPDGLNIQSIKDAMGQSLVSFQALAWYFFETMLEGKHLADVANLLGEHQVAFRLYCAITHQLGQWKVGVVKPGADVAKVAQSGLIFDTLISLAYLHMKMGDMHQLTSTCAELELALQVLEGLKASTRDAVFEQAETRIRHILVLGELFTLDPNEIASSPGKTVGDVIELFSKHSDDLYYQYDLRILEAVENKKASAKNHLLLENCSGYKLRPIISAVHQSDMVPRKPDHIVGLQNVKTLSELSAETKRAINAAQRKFNAPVTQWD